MDKARAERITTKDTRFERRIEAAERALRALVRDFYGEQFGRQVDDKVWKLDFQATVKPGERWDLRFDPPLVQQLLPQMQRVEAESNAFREGSVYCFQCESNDCEHACPRSTLEVFAGYGQVGQPRWSELTQYLLDRADERVDMLFATPPRLLARTDRGRDLKARQLAVFGRSSKTYAILGQVTAGFFRGRSGADGEERLAITFQAVETPGAKGRAPNIALNTIAKIPGGQELEEWLGGRYQWVADARKEARKALTTLRDKIAKNPGDRNALALVPEILRKLARDIQSGHRKGQRRTRHAQERREIRRPVDKAMADLREARPDRFYFDLKTKTIVLVAGKGRCHVFTEEGRHVTSFVINAESVQARLRKKRWAVIEPDRLTRFLANASGITDLQTANN